MATAQLLRRIRPTASNSNNFGLGLFGASQFNLIEKNKIGGNINGLYLGGGKVTGNIIRRNAMLGNPSAEAIREFGPSIGADIQNFSPGANTFDDNRCLVYFTELAAVNKRLFQRRR